MIDIGAGWDTFVLFPQNNKEQIAQQMDSSQLFIGRQMLPTCFETVAVDGTVLTPEYHGALNTSTP